MLVFLYVPILVLIVQSFNAGKSRAKWEGFSLRWYQETVSGSRPSLSALAGDPQRGADRHGGVHAPGHPGGHRHLQHEDAAPSPLMMTLTNLPNTMPDIVTGHFADAAVHLHQGGARATSPCSWRTSPSTPPYVILSVMPKLKQMNKHTYEAAPGPGRHPHLCPDPCADSRVQAGHHHRRHAGLHPVPGRLYHQLLHHQPPGAEPLHADLLRRRKGIKPSLNALSALMFVSLLVLLLIVNRRTAEKKITETNSGGGRFSKRSASPGPLPRTERLGALGERPLL